MALLRGLSRTTAVLLVGRVIDPGALTWGQARAIIDIAHREGVRLGIELAALVAGDSTTSGEIDSGDDQGLPYRLAVGLPFVSVDADDGPAGPLPRSVFEAAMETAQGRLTPLFWKRVAAHVSDTSNGHPGAVLRAATGDPPLFAGIALDRSELEAGQEAVHLLSFGPLSYAGLAEGTLVQFPSPDDFDEEIPKGVLYGQASGQRRHRLGVRGRRIAFADSHGAGSQRVQIQEVRDAPGLYLWASYD